MKAGGKKGNMVFEGIMIIVVLFMLGITVLVGYMALSDWNVDLQADPDIPDIAKNLTAENVEQYHSVWDGVMVFLIAMLWIVVIVSAYLIDSNPVFFVVSIVVLAVVLILAAQLSNAYAEFAEDDDLQDAAAGFPFTKWIFDHLVQLVMAIAFSVGVALYAKIRGGGGG